MLASYPRIRLAIYLLSVLGAIAAPFVAVESPEYGAAAASAVGVLATAAGVTAASNLPKRDG